MATVTFSDKTYDSNKVRSQVVITYSYTETGNSATVSWSASLQVKSSTAGTKISAPANSGIAWVQGGTDQQDSAKFPAKTVTCTKASTWYTLSTIATRSKKINKVKSAAIAFQVGASTYAIDSAGDNASDVSTTKNVATIPAWSSYAVAYNANGGTGAPGNQTKWYNETLTLSTTKPTREGYTFKCWNTNARGTGTNYNPGASYTGNAALSLYAVWEPRNVVNVYDANGNVHKGRVTVYDANGNARQCIVSAYDANGNKRQIN